MAKVIVIGGGIIGLSSAYYLQQSGHDVTIIERNDFSDNCSFGNLGYVCPSHFIPLAAPGIIKQGLKWMLNSNSPFYIKPALNKALMDWGWKFMRSATKRNVDAAAVPLRDISLLSQREYELWAQNPRFDFSYEHKGMLEIFQTSKSAEHAEHTVKSARELGLDVSLLDKKALKLLEPQTTLNAIGAVFFKCDAHLYPNKLMKLLLEHLKSKSATLIPEEEVIKLERVNGNQQKVITNKNAYDGDVVVIATGAWSRELALMAGVQLPLVPGRGYSLTLENSPYQINHPAILVEGRVAMAPMDGNKIRVGGTMEIVATKTAPQYGRVAGIIKSVKDFFPEFNIPMPATANIWSGFRPCSADGLPYIGRAKKNRNIIIATGHSMMGLSLGPGTGKLVTQLVNEQAPEIDISSFDVERFN